MKRKKVQTPVYQTMKDNAYITGLRQDLPTYRDYYNTALGKLNYWSPEYQQDMMNLAEDFTGSEWNDLTRAYQKAYNQLAQSNYNRFGSLGSTGALYNQETLQRDYNDLASRVAAQTAKYYDTLRANEYNRRLTSAQLYGNAYGTTGGDIYTHDQQNWNIGNKNIEAKYVADVQNANRRGGLGDALIGGVTGALSGFATGGPWGALAGGVGGALAGGFGGSTDSTTSLGAGLGSTIYGATGNQGTYLANRLGQGFGNARGNAFAYPSYNTDFSLNTKYDPTSFKFSWQ